MYDDAREWTELRTQFIGQHFYASPESIHTPLQGIINGDTEANFARVVGLPVLKTACIGSYLISVFRYPFCCMQIEKRRLKAFENALAYIEKACASWTAQVFAP